MSDQSQTAPAKSAAEPVMCKMGCGFFGNGSTGGCCSKCFGDLAKKEGSDATITAPVEDIKPMEVVEEKAQPMEMENLPQPNPIVEPETVVEPQPAETLKKKKKKKASYKNMMSGMMNPMSPSRDAQKDNTRFEKLTGGGAFTKIDKI